MSMRIKTRSFLIVLLAVLVVTIIFSAVFFIYTATRSAPVAMELKMPSDGKAIDDNHHPAATLTLLLLKNDMIYGYFGNDIQSGKSLTIKETRKIILEGAEKVTRDSLMVIIKPTQEATYRNTVDILDQMTTNGVKKYKMIDLNKKEKDFLAKAE
jgi:biopolymer transport protein ExbD